MNCETSQHLFSEYYDGGLGSTEVRALEHHLGECGTCKVEYEHFTTSLKLLHDTGPVETTRIFVKNVKTAAADHLERRELYQQTGIESVPSPAVAAAPRAGAPLWVPFALAGVTLAAFGLGWFVARRNTDREVKERVAAIEKLYAGRPPDKVIERVPPDVKKIMEDYGLVNEGGLWIPRVIKEGLEKGQVWMGGKMMDRKEVAARLLKEFPPEVPKPPDPAPLPAANLEGHVKIEEFWVPTEWVEKLKEGYVQTGVNTWEKRDDLKQAFIKENNLVEHQGKLISRWEYEEARSRQLVQRPDAAPASHAVTRLIEGLEIGAPVTSGRLTVYPLIAHAPTPEVSFRTLQSALAGGKLELTDKESLFTVQARNSLDDDVLLLAGEILTGGRCARVVAEDTFVPKKKTAAVPVFCVEPGVWNPAERFVKESGHYIAPPTLRRALIGEQGQGAVWAILSKQLEKGRSGQADLFKKYQDAILDYRGDFSDLPDREPGAIGMAVAIGDALEYVELFQNHAFFTATFDRLIGGAALEALQRPAETLFRPAPPFPNSVKGVKQLLENAFFCAYDARENGGVAIRRDGAGAGRACLSAEGVSHVSLFAAGPPSWDRRATYAVPKDKMKKALDDYEARFKSPALTRKIAALHEAASINVPEVTPLLARHLDDKDPAVQRTVIQELGGRTGDAQAFELLNALLTRTRKEALLFSEVVRALTRLGNERAVDPLLRQIEGGDPELGKMVVQALPELLWQLRSRDLLEKAVDHLVRLQEGLTPFNNGDLDDVARGVLRNLFNRDFAASAACRAWWNENRERFLRERTGK